MTARFLLDFAVAALAYTACNIGWGIAAGLSFSALMTERRIAPWWLTVAVAGMAPPLWRWWARKTNNNADQEETR